MGLMEKMRGATGPVLWVLVFAFGILFMLQDTDVFSVMQAGPRSLGEVDGRSISQTDYNERINAYTEQYTQENGTAPSIEERARFRELVWDQLVVELALQSEMEKLGIQVSDREVVEAVTGENPDPIIRQIFGRPDGTIDRATLRSLIEQPEMRSDWLLIEDQIRENRMQQKVNRFMQSAVMVTTREVEQEYLRENSRASVSFIRFPYSNISDSEVEVSDSELQAYHRDNSDDFEREKTWEFSYVSFSKAPTAEDTLRSKEELAQLRQDFASTSDDSVFVQLNFSTTEFDGSFKSRDDVRQPYTVVFELEEGEVSQPLIDENQVAIAKKIEQRDDEVKYAVISRVIAADRTITRREAEAADFREFARLDGFDAEAEMQELQVREATATKGTPFIPGIGQSRVTMSALESMSEGDISEVIELDDQFLVIQVESVMEKGVRPLDEVRRQVENAVRREKRRDLMVERIGERYAGAASLQAIAEESDRSIQTAESLRMSANNISGAGREPGLIGAIFRAEEGELIGPYRGENAAFFFVVENHEKADLAGLGDDERQRIRTRLNQEKNQVFTRQLVARLQEEAEVTDNRQRMFGGM